MTPQKKLMFEDAYDDGCSSWRIACGCGSPEHDAQLWFEADSDDKKAGTINLTLTMEVGIWDNVGHADWWKWWGPITRFFKIVTWRTKLAAKILFYGYSTHSGSVILDLDGIKAMQTALDEGIKHGKTHKC